MASEKSVMAVIRASRPFFRGNADKVAFVIHSSFLAAGFVLTATGQPAFAEDALSSSSTDEVGIEHWNDVEDEYAFVYSNPERSSKKVLIKCLVMGHKLLVDALADAAAAEPVHLEININEYVREDTNGNHTALYNNLGKLVNRLDSDILSKLGQLADGPSAKDASGGMLPPGNRFDPYGPPGVPGFEPDRFTRQPGGRTHPDLEQPGSGDFDYI